LSVCATSMRNDLRRCDADGPDYRFGWGLMNTFAAAQLMTNNAAYNSKPHIKEVTLPDGEQVVFHVMADSSMPLCVTICWSDPAGPALTTFTAPDPQDAMLVNNLELTVEQLDGRTLYRPWVLNPDLDGESAALRSAAATRGVDNRNNVERVSIAAPAAGHVTPETHSSTAVAASPPLPAFSRRPC